MPETSMPWSATTGAWKTGGIPSRTSPTMRTGVGSGPGTPPANYDYAREPQAAGDAILHPLPPPRPRADKSRRAEPEIPPDRPLR